MSQIEKTLKRDDGTKIRFIADFHSTYSIPTMKIRVTVCQPGKRTFKALYDTNSYTWRSLDNTGKSKYVAERVRELVTQEELDRFIDDVCAALALRFKRDLQFTAW